MLGGAVMKGENHFAGSLSVRTADGELAALSGQFEIEAIGDLTQVHVQRAAEVSQLLVAAIKRHFDGKRTRTR